MKPLGPIPPDFRSDDDGTLLIGKWRAPVLVNAQGGTPLFAYDMAIVRDRVARFRAAMPSEVALHYAVKANPFGPLLEAIAPLVDGFDIASIGELHKLPASDKAISFAGPGKSPDEIEVAVAAGITLNVESAAEARIAVDLGKRMEIRPRLAVRVNPPFGLKGSGMKMGGLASPFGVDHDQVPDLVRWITDAGADWRGFHIYAGSQALSADAIIEVQQSTVALAAELADAIGTAPPEINLGGGFGIPYFAKDEPLDLEMIGASLQNTLKNRAKILSDTKFAIELGRWLVGECGVYLTRIVDRKTSRGRTFLITDGGLHHQLAASGNFGQLLRRNYPVAIANRFAADADEEATVVGCLCTPLDILADEAMLPRAEVGDLVAVFCAGAYGLTASPTAFLSQTPAREILV